MFENKQIVWAKTKGYPWWPAEVSKIPSTDHNYFKVCFVGENNHALLQAKAIRKYLQFYNDLKNKKYKGLQNSIDLANTQVQKRKTSVNEEQIKMKTPCKAPEKTRSIKKKNKKKKKSKRNQPKAVRQQDQDGEQSDRNQVQKQQKRDIFLSGTLEKNSQIKQRQVKSDDAQPQSICLSQMAESSQQLQLGQLQYVKKVDRKKIQHAQQELFSFIQRFNAMNFEKQRQCYQTILRMEEKQFSTQELLQSKITNMITYLLKKLEQNSRKEFSKEQMQEISSLNKKLKLRVVNYLFDCCYYDQFLKRMQRAPIEPTSQKAVKPNKDSGPCSKKHRKYRRKLPTKKKQGEQLVK